MIILHKKINRKTIIEFIKYNFAGTAFFWSTYGLFFVFERLLGWHEGWALVVASIIGHIIFFTLNKTWVFSAAKKSKQKLHTEAIRFALFMGMNFFINIGIVLGLSKLGLTPYLGQFVSMLFFVFWNFIGLRYWVFKPAKKTTKRSSRSKHGIKPTPKQKAA